MQELAISKIVAANKLLDEAEKLMTDVRNENQTELELGTLGTTLTELVKSGKVRFIEI